MNLTAGKIVLEPLPLSALLGLGDVQGLEILHIPELDVVIVRGGRY